MELQLLDSYLSQPGYSSLFFLGFLAATILPIGSEWLLILMIAQGFDIPRTVFVASIGNFLGGCTTYYIGICGGDIFTRRVLRMGEKDVERAQKVFFRYGSWSLLLSWVPILGDPLCLVAGLMKTPLFRFSLLVFLGKFCRYATLAFLTLQATG